MKIDKGFPVLLLLLVTANHLHYGADHTRDVGLRLQEKRAYLTCLKAEMGRLQNPGEKEKSPDKYRFIEREIARMERKIQEAGSVASGRPPASPQLGIESKKTDKFYRDYLDHLLYLVSVFHEKSNEVMALDDSEVLGDRCPMNTLFLTFDDGPEGTRTQAVMDILREEEVHATFFVLGENLDRKDEKAGVLLRRMTADGHAIGLHGWQHGVLDKEEPGQDLVKELERSIELIQEGGGIKPAFFRVPYGRRSLALVKELKSLGLRHILWNIDSLDWNRALTDDEVRERVVRLARLYDGGIVLFHDPVPRTAGILREILRQLKNEGFRFLSLNEWHSFEKYGSGESK